MNIYFIFTKKLHKILFRFQIQYVSIVFFQQKYRKMLGNGALLSFFEKLP